MPVIETTNPESPDSQHSDDEDIFNLDMVTMDMNFEQAYSMYTQLQQKNALLEVEELERVQQLNNSHGNGNLHGNDDIHVQETVQHDIFAGQNAYAQPQTLSSKEWGQIPRQYPGNQVPSTQISASVLQTQLPHHEMDILPQNHINTSNGMRHSSLPVASTGTLISPPGETIEGYGGVFSGQNPHVTRQQGQFLHEEGEDVDQFFSTTESSALDKFLDTLAFSSEVNPLEFYHQNQPKMPHMFEMQTMSHHENLGLSDSVKRDIAHAFQIHQSHDLKSFGGESQTNIQLRTPENSLGQIDPKRRREEEPQIPESATKKRRKSVKPLLSLTQKRLNHSHLEQKRRLLCKEAYDRCLRLVTNVDDYKNELVSAASTGVSSRKRSKRKQLNKDGLPNLSKHSALLKISNEIIKIQSKNEELRKLLGQF